MDYVISQLGKVTISEKLCTYNCTLLSYFDFLHHIWNFVEGYDRRLSSNSYGHNAAVRCFRDNRKPFYDKWMALLGIGKEKIFFL
ncbi:MAG: hypothetical protein QXF29_02590 [Archaeoglobaceae archaeon]